MNLNRELHEALGYCWHEADNNPDYKAEPWLVIREMDKWDKAHHTHPDERFINNLGCMEYEVVSVDLILDTTGKLAQLALDWLQKEEL